MGPAAATWVDHLESLLDITWLVIYIYISKLRPFLELRLVLSYIFRLNYISYGQNLSSITSLLDGGFSSQPKLDRSQESLGTKEAR